MHARYGAAVQRWRVWAPPSTALVSMAALTLTPAPLLPIARMYQDLCDRYPVLAILTNHLPPLPVAFLIAVITFALVSGGAAGLARFVRTRRLVRWLDRQPCGLPERLGRVSQQLVIGDRVLFLDQPVIAAFCFGLIRPRIVLSAGMLERLDDDELLAVLAHERHHLRRRDPLRYLLLHTATASALMFPLSTFLCRRVEARMELAADRAALTLSSRAALAGALLTALGNRETLVVGTAGLSATEARVAHLLGQGVLPAIPARAVISSLVPLIVLGLAVADLASSSHLVRMACAFCVRAF